MERVFQNSFAPVFSGHCYNFARESGVVLKHIAAATSPRAPFFLYSEHEALSDAVVSYVASAASSFIDDSIDFYWLSYQGYKNYQFLAKDLWDCLLQQLMRSSEIGAMAHKRVLLPPLFGVDEESFYLAYVKTRLQIIGNGHLVFVIDLMNARIDDEFVNSAFFSLLMRLLKHEAPRITVIFALPADAATHLSNLCDQKNSASLTSFSPEVGDFIRDSMTRRNANLSPAIPTRAESSAPALNLGPLLPLLHLNTPAERRVLDYIGRHGGLARLPLTENPGNLLKPTADGGMSLTSAGRCRLSDRRTARRPPAIIMNGAHALMFRSPEYFVANENGFSLLRSRQNTHHDLFDLVIHGITASQHGDQATFFDSIELLKRYSQAAHKMVADSRDHTRLILRYASQFILGNADACGGRLFQMLDLATSGYCDFLSQSDEDVAREIEMAQYNLGYIYDTLRHSRITPVTAQGDVSHYYLRAAEAIERATGIPATDRLNIYRRAWHHYDAGNKSLSRDLFLQAARDSFQQAGVPGLSREEIRSNRLLGHECLTIALSMAPHTALPADLSAILDIQLLELGGFLGREDFLHFLCGKDEQEIAFLPPWLAKRCTAVCILFNRPDIVAALRVAHDLVWRLNVPVRMVAVGEGDDTSGHSIGSAQNIILGAPDSGGGMPGILHRLDSELRRIYQANVTAEFASSPRFYKDGSSYVVLLSDGPGTFWTSWMQVCEDDRGWVRLEGKKIMFEIVATSILFPMLSAARDQLAKKIVDRLVDKVTKGEGGISTAATRDDANELRNVLKALGNSADLAAKLEERALADGTRQALAKYLQASAAIGLLGDLAKDLSVGSAEIEDISGIARSAVAAASHLSNQGGFRARDKEVLSKYEIQFGNYVHEADELKLSFDISGRYPSEKVNDLVVRIKGTIGNFRDLAEKVSS